jgi:hypothetical protein
MLIFFGFGPDALDVDVIVDIDVCASDWETVIYAGFGQSVGGYAFAIPVLGLLQGKFCHSHDFWHLESGMVLGDLDSLFDHGL